MREIVRMLWSHICWYWTRQTGCDLTGAFVRKGHKAGPFRLVHTDKEFLQAMKLRGKERIPSSELVQVYERWLPEDVPAVCHKSGELSMKYIMPFSVQMKRTPASYRQLTLLCISTNHLESEPPSSSMGWSLAECHERPLSTWPRLDCRAEQPIKLIGWFSPLPAINFANN